MGWGANTPSAIGRYEVEREIGRGGMGVVYLANDPALGRRVAIKVLPEHLFENADSRERFFREARLAASLDHPHVIPMFEVNEHEGRPYLVMRYVESPDLGRLLLRDGILSVVRVVTLVGQIGRALDAAHSHGVVHRDVKPANVLVADDGVGGDHCYLTDFGLAREVPSTRAASSGLLGTVAYMAPEQVRTSSVDGRADIYSLGCLLYQCLTGAPPFTGIEAAVLWAHLDQPPPTFSARRNDLPAAVDHVITRVLAKDPADRFQTCAELVDELTEALGFAIETRIRVPAHPASARERVPTPGNRLIGRDRELAEVGGWLSPENRLITITGPGGTGKTRLAIELARTTRDRFPDGVWFVRLAPLGDPGLVMAFIAAAIGLVPSGDDLARQLGEYLCHRNALVVLDNFEHVMSAARDVSALDFEGSLTTLLVTSRSPLRLLCEREYARQPLRLPVRTEAHDAASLGHCDAVALFVERAASARPDFRLTEANGQEVAEICALVDGLPLAIELAAARIKLLAPKELRARLSDSLAILTSAQRDLPDRHQSLLGTIDWSYDLLSEDQQSLLAELSVFAGDFSLAAAEVVSTAEEATLERLEALTDASLVRIDTTEDETRFRLLRTVRRYADERLSEAGRKDAVGRRHLAYYARLVGDCSAALFFRGQVRALSTLTASLDDIRGAVRFATQHDDYRTAARIVVALGKYWDMTGAWSEGRRSIAMVLGGTGVEMEDRGALLAWQALGAIRHGDIGEGTLLSDQAVELLRPADPGNALPFALQVRATAEFELQHYAAAAALQEEAIELAANDPDTVRRSLLLCDLANSQTDYAESVRLAFEAEALCAERGDGWGVTLIALNRSEIAIDAGHYGQARRELEECRRLHSDVLDASPTLGTQFYLNHGLAELGSQRRSKAVDDLLAALRLADQTGKLPFAIDAADALTVAYAKRRPATAAWLDGFVDRQRKDLTLPSVEPLIAELRRADIEPLIERLGQERFRSLQADGAASSLADVRRALLPEAAPELLL
jgi:predicted ATPase/serine/threonine protein kinase